MSAWTAFPGAIQMPHVRTQLLDTAANATRVTQETELFVRRKVSTGKGRNGRIIKPCPYEHLKKCCDNFHVYQSGNSVLLLF